MDNLDWQKTKSNKISISLCISHKYMVLTSQQKLQHKYAVLSYNEDDNNSEGEQEQEQQETGQTKKSSKRNHNHKEKEKGRERRRNTGITSMFGYYLNIPFCVFDFHVPSHATESDSNTQTHLFIPLVWPYS